MTSPLGESIKIAISRIEPILNQGEVKTHELVQRVTGEDLYPWSSDSLLALYQKQFITQAALSELYFEYASGDEKILAFTPISVRIKLKDEQIVDAENSHVTEADYQPNFSFYLDEANFYSATSDSVQAMLDSFWKSYTSFMDFSPALALFGLNEEAEWKEVQREYRRLASRHHPDKGGKKEKFTEIRQAFESLKHHYSNR